MEHTQMLRINKLKGSGKINIAARHNLREIQAETGADSHIDPRKSSQNVVLRGAGRAAAVAAEAVRLMEQAKVKPLRNDAVRGLEILVSLPPASGIAERDFFSDAVAWAEQFFEVPILSAVIHNDEAAPHCHVILLPLFDGRMIGSGLVGSKARLIAMQADFHEKVGRVYGLKRGTPAKRYSRAARATAGDKVITALRRAKNSLDDPAICDALREAMIETMPVRLMELLGLDMPEVRTPKPKTCTSILIKNCPERKPEKPVGFQNRKPIGFAAVTDDPKEQSLSCVGFGVSPLPVPPDVPPDNAPLQNEYIREREIEQAGYWDGERGEFIKMQVKTKTRSAKVDRVRVAIQAMQR